MKHETNNSWQFAAGVLLAALAISALLAGWLVARPTSADSPVSTGIDLSGKNPVVDSAEPINITPSISSDPASAADAGLSCRHGIASINESNQWIDTLEAGWWVDFRATSNPAANVDSEYVRMIRFKQMRDGDGGYLDGYTVWPTVDVLRTLVQNNPNQLWLLGNEPDRVDVQDDMWPGMYARAYHDVYTLIKEEDPTANVANAGLVQFTPIRRQYLDKVWDKYLELYNTPMPVDVWNVHIYALPEVDVLSGNPSIAHVPLGTDIGLAKFTSGGSQQGCSDPLDQTYCFAEHDSMAIFEQQLRDVRQWMKDRGQQSKPLILTEYSILWPYEADAAGCFLQDEYGNCFDPPRVNTFLEETVALFENYTDPDLGMPTDNNKLLQQWLWFSTWSDEVGNSSNLLAPGYRNMPAGSTDALSDIGNKFRTLGAAIPTTPNLIVESVYGSNADSSAGSATVDMTVVVRNNGNIHLNQAFTVEFYSDAAMTNVIDTVAVDPVIDGCARTAYHITGQRTTSTSGSFDFWVKVDAGNAISEVSESDNTGSASSIVDPTRIYAPSVES